MNITDIRLYNKPEMRLIGGGNRKPVSNATFHRHVKLGLVPDPVQGAQRNPMWTEHAAKTYFKNLFGIDVDTLILEEGGE